MISEKNSQINDCLCASLRVGHRRKQLCVSNNISFPLALRENREVLKRYKAAIKREKNGTCSSYSEQKQARPKVKVKTRYMAILTVYTYVEQYMQRIGVQTRKHIHLM